MDPTAADNKNANDLWWTVVVVKEQNLGNTGEGFLHAQSNFKFDTFQI